MSLIKLTIEDVKVSLPLDFVIRLVFRMPLPYLENVPAAITYWFNIMSNPVNDRIFKHANFIYAEHKLRIYDCILDIAGLQMKGKLYLKNATFNDYKAFIVFNDLVEQISSKKISEIVDDVYHLGVDTNAIIAEAKRMQGLNYPDVKYGFPPIINSLFFNGENDKYQGVVNNWDHNYGNYWKNYYDSGNDETINRNTLVPQPYLRYVLDEVLKFIDYKAVGSIVNDEEFSKLLLYNNFSAEKVIKTDYFFGKIDEVFFTHSTEFKQVIPNIVIEDDDNTYSSFSGLYSSGETGAFKIKFRADAMYSDVWDTNTISIYYYDQYGQHLLGSKVIPVGTRTYIDFEIQPTIATPNMTFFVNANMAGQCWLWNVEIEVYPAVNVNVNVFANDINLKNHLPELTVSDFINGIIKKFCLAAFFDFESKQLELTNWNDIIDNNNYIDITSALISESEDISFEQKIFSLITKWNNDELTEGNFTLSDKEQNIIRVNSFGSTFPEPSKNGQLMLLVPINLVLTSKVNTTNGNLEWLYSSDYFQDIVNSGVEVLPLEIPISCLFVREKLANEIYYPAIEQTGTSNLSGKNEPGFKVLNNHGFVTTDLYYFPFATSNNKSYDGSLFKAFNLNMADTDGLYSTLHKKLYDYVSSKNSIEQQFDINDDIFHKLVSIFKANQNIRKIRVGAKNYIPEQVDISIGLNDFKACKITMR